MTSNIVRRGTSLVCVVVGAILLGVAAGPVRAADNEAAADAEAKKAGERLLSTVQGAADARINWHDRWMDDSASTSEAGAAVLRLNESGMSRGEIKKIIPKLSGDHRDLSRNLDTGRHELLKLVIQKAILAVNVDLVAKKMAPIKRVVTINSGKTGDFTRDIDLTLYTDDAVREKMLLEKIQKMCMEGTVVKLAVHADPKVGVERGLSLPQLETELMRGSLDLPDARFAEDVVAFGRNYKDVVAKQSQNPEAYWGFANELEVEGRRSLTTKPGQTFVQEFLADGDKVHYQGRIASSIREMQAIMAGAQPQRARRAQYAGHIMNNFQQAQRHENSSDSEPSQGAIKYMARTIDSFCAFHGMRPWRELVAAEREEVLRLTGLRMNDNQRAIIADAIEAACIMDLSTVKPKVVPAEVGGRKVNAGTASVACLLLMKRMAAITTAAAAREMLVPPMFHPEYERQKMKDPAWRKMNEDQRRAVALADGDTRNETYRKCIQVAAMENLLTTLREFHAMDQVKNSRSNATTGADAIRGVFGSVGIEDGDVRQVLEIANEHARISIAAQNETDPRKRMILNEQLRERQMSLFRLMGMESEGKQILAKAAAGTESDYLRARQDRMSGKMLPFSEEVEQAAARLRKQQEEKIPPEYDEMSLREKIRAVGPKKYIKERLYEEAFQLGTIVDGLQLIELYQADASNEQMAEALTISFLSRAHWSVGFFVQAAGVSNEKQLKDLGKNIVFDGLSRVIPGVGTFKIVFDIEKGLVIVTVGYTFNQLNLALINTLYMGDIGRNPDAPAGMVWLAKKEGVEPVLNPDWVCRVQDKKGKAVVYVDRARVYRDFFTEVTGYAYDATDTVSVKKANSEKFLRAHEKLVAVIRRNAAQKEPLWFPREGEKWTPPSAPTAEETSQAIEAFKIAIDWAGQRIEPFRTKRPFDTAPRQWIVENSDGQKYDAIEEGLRQRFTNDVLVGMMEAWNSDLLATVLAKREVETMAYIADVKQTAGWLSKMLLRPRGRTQPLQLSVYSADGSSLANTVFDGAEPLPLKVSLSSEGAAAASSNPDVVLTQTNKKLRKESGDGPFKKGDIVIDEFTVEAHQGSESGPVVAQQVVKVRVRLPGPEDKPVLLTREARWDDEKKGPVREKYSYYDDSAMKHPSMKGVKKWKAESGRVYHGLYTSYNSKGEKETEQEFKFGIKHGAYRAFDEKGGVHFQGNFVDGIEDGPQTNFYPDGMKNWEMVYEGGEIKSLTTYWDKGIVRNKVTYEWQDRKEGLQCGTWESYYSNGKPVVKGLFRGHRAGNDSDGISTQCRHGQWVVYRKDGTTEEDVNYVNGARDGSAKFYDKDGKLTSEGSFKAGKENGAWKRYDAKGNVIFDGTYTDGKETEAEVRSYNDRNGDGKLMTVEHRRNGELHGTSISYGGRYEDGKFLMTGKEGRVMVYDKGFCVEDTEFYAEGTKKAYRTYIRKGEGADSTEQYFYPNGKMKSESIKTGKTGTCTSWYENGAISSKGVSEEEMLAGKWVYNYDSGKVKEEGEYLKGDRHGSWRFYYMNGQLSDTGSYIKGEKTGRWESYDGKGKRTSWTEYKDGKSVNSGSYKD